MYDITVTALGPGPRDLLTLGAVESIQRAPKVVLRTGRHDAAAYLRESGVEFDTLDSLYAGSGSFDDLCLRAVEHLMALAEEVSVCYAVPDPAQDETVRLLKERAGGKVHVLPGVPLTAVPMAHAPVNAPVVVSSAAALDVTDSQRAVCITEIAGKALAGECKLRLLAFYDEDTPVLFFPPGADGRHAVRIALEDLDRQPAYDHTAAALVLPKPFIKKRRRDVQDLINLLRALRGENGCPWDREQTHQSLAKYLIEEAYETTSAIAQEDWDAVADELGDVLLQVVFHADVGAQYGTLDLADITSKVCAKMVSRHQHIFGGASLDTAGEVLESWERIKAGERGEKTLADRLAGITAGLPPVLRAFKAQERAASAGFDWDGPEGALLKVHEEADELGEELKKGRMSRDELGDLLFACINVARLMGLDPDESLEEATKKFIRRVSWMDSAIIFDKKAWKDLTSFQMDVYWNRSKHEA